MTELKLPQSVPGENRFEKTMLVCEGGIATQRISLTMWEACEEIYAAGGTVTDVANDPAIRMLNYQLGFIYSSAVPDKKDAYYLELENSIREKAVLTKRERVLDWLEEADVLMIDGNEARLVVDKTVPAGSSRAVAALRWDEGNNAEAAVITDACLKEAAFSNTNVSFTFKNLDGRDVQVVRELIPEAAAAPSM